MQGRDACSAMHYSMQTQQPPEAAIFMTSSQLEKWLSSGISVARL